MLAAVANGAEIADSGAFAQAASIDHAAALVPVLLSLDALQMVKLGVTSNPVLALTEEGASVIAKGSPEAQLHAALPESGAVPKAELDASLGADFMKIAVANAKRAGWIAIGKGDKGPELSRASATITDTVADHLKALKAAADAAAAQGGVMSAGAPVTVLEAKLVKDLTKRKLVATKTIKTFKVTQGPKWAAEVTKMATDLTKELLASGEWETATFKEYNFDGAMGVPPATGALHPLMKVRREYRELFLNMGFEEMPTNRFVESSFWNFDALFQPQQHPARDMHDTFFLTQPASTIELPADYVANVKEIHENGGHGSRGYRYNWSEEEGRKNIMRTHTTAISARMLYQLSQDCMSTGEFQPKKYFSIDRVFRNETVDATHLAEFHQIEGLVCDRNLTLGHLMGVIGEFFTNLGLSEFSFKPAYNPYTEPSMEIFYYHKGLDKLVEIGNSGVFRPEMLQPMGFPEDVTVVAWGLSLERPTMIKYGINNIRDLVGHKIQLSNIKANPLCRLDVE